MISLKRLILETKIDKNRLFDSPDYLERVAEKLGYPTDFTKLFWNQHYIPTLYHCTTPENYEKIKVEGLKQRNDRRGAISNRHIGPAIFTTSEPDEISFFSQYYGNVVIAINAKQMKADGFTPPVEKEPDWASAEMIEFVLRKMGDEDADASRFVDSSDQNTQGTVIIYSDIPIKYLSLAS